MGLWLPCGGFKSLPGPLESVRPPSHAWRKLASLVVVIVSLSIGLVGVGMATSGKLWALALCLVTPFGIWAATRIVPPKGTTKFLDKNL